MKNNKKITGFKFKRDNQVGQTTNDELMTSWDLLEKRNDINIIVNHQSTIENWNELNINKIGNKNNKNNEKKVQTMINWYYNKIRKSYRFSIVESWLNGPSEVYFMVCFCLLISSWKSESEVCAKEEEFCKLEQNFGFNWIVVGWLVGCIVGQRGWPRERARWRAGGWWRSVGMRDLGESQSHLASPHGPTTVTTTTTTSTLPPCHLSVPQKCIFLCRSRVLSWASLCSAFIVYW